VRALVEARWCVCVAGGPDGGAGFGGRAEFGKARERAHATVSSRLVLPNRALRCRPSHTLAVSHASSSNNVCTVLCENKV
jgi:hypothetical protein